jgi:hypothetical protein
MFSDKQILQIGIHSYCNRKCNWCPNKFIDRSFYEELPEDIYLKILNELKENNFGKNYKKPMITFSRYNEPMYNIDLLNKRAKQAKEILPEVNIIINTNGDYLENEDILKGLNIDHLAIMDYDCKGKDKIKGKLNSLNVDIDNIELNLVIGHYNDISISYTLNWPRVVNLEDRGGILDKEIYYYDPNRDKEYKMLWQNDKQKRIKPCTFSSEYISIDYKGNVLTCCPTRGDWGEHEKYVLGNIKNNSLTDIYSNQNVKDHYEKLCNGNFEENNLNACLYCHEYKRPDVVEDEIL